MDLLLSNRAELLLSLEHVTMEMLRMPSEDHSRISFDANDYRLLRIEELRLSAAAAADRVKRTGTYFVFNPMNSRERRVIHLALRNLKVFFELRVSAELLSLPVKLLQLRSRCRIRFEHPLNGGGQGFECFLAL